MLEVAFVEVWCYARISHKKCEHHLEKENDYE
jgi:hypothetical protein